MVMKKIIDEMLGMREIMNQRFQDMDDIGKSGLKALWGCDFVQRRKALTGYTQHTEDEGFPVV